MGLFSFGSKKDKVRKMLESNQIETVVEQALKDNKIINSLFELLNEKNPGIIGDSLLALTSILERNKEMLTRNLKKESILKCLDLVKVKNPYVKENAMMFLGFLMRENPEIFMDFREEIIRGIKETLELGDKNDKAFALLMIGEFKLSEFKPQVEELANVEDKIILPFEGMKWVPLGNIAKETLEKLR
ncbi:hypothetical protein [Thermococcus sp.]